MTTSLTRRSLTRRGLAAGTFALPGAGAVPARAIGENAVGAIEKRHGGRLGVFVLDTGSGRTKAYRAEERFLLCSTFKGLLAAMVLSRVDAGRDDLARLVPYGATDLRPSSR